MATMQEQGVPVPDRLGPGPSREREPRLRRTRTTKPLENEVGVEENTDYYYAADYKQTPERTTRQRSSPRRNTNLKKYNPASAGKSAMQGIGMLEGEFLLAIFLLILLMFANNKASYTERMMSFIKRGALTCLLFFILALISGIGPKTEKAAKAFGALVIVGLLVTSPANTVIEDVDNLIKNDWIGTTPDLSASGSAKAGTQKGSGNGPGGFKTLTESEISKLAHAAVGTPAYNSFTAELRAFKSGAVWKVPVDAVNTLEQTGIHDVKSAFGALKGILGHLGL